MSSVSQPEATKALSAHLLDTALLLEANLDSVTGTDSTFSRLVSRIGLENQLAESAASVDASMKAAQVENPTTNPFLFATPVAGFVSSLPVLHGQFQATDPTRAMTEAGQWQATAAEITGVVSELGGVIAALSSSAETDWVRQAIERVNRIQWAGGHYAAHATAMGVHAGNLATVASAEKIAAAAAHATWMAAPLKLKPVLEQSYLVAFPPRLNAGLIPTVPGFNQLLPPLDAMPGTTFDPGALTTPQAPGFESHPLPAVVRDALAAHGYGDLAYAETPQQVVDQFGHASPQVMDAISAGSLPTEAAAHVATLPPPAAAAGAAGPGPAIPAGGSGLFGGAVPHGIGGMSAAGTRPGSGPGSGLGAGLGPAGFGGAAGRGGSGRSPALGSSFGASSGVIAGAGMSKALSGAAGALPGWAAGPAAPFGAGAMPAPGSSAAGAGGVAGGAGQTGSGANAGQRGAVMGAPGLGGASTSGGGRKRKVRAVTSTVERNGNLKALLGDAPAVLPDVIGDSVRAPR
ncbi:hypothetical protein [Corynebacterium liangguodongii]|uniref:hypothetical protein n=1 Tax=Corynebacterium liangguodongii TaxID=2079535 RepID=UPI00131F0722|nr:hypothetical protein [Corynebacterium liangguodongii]